MRELNLLCYMDLADPRYVEEAAPAGVLRIRRKRRARMWAACACLAAVVLMGAVFAEPAMTAWDMRNTVVSWPSPPLPGASVKPSPGVFISAELPTRKKMDADQPFTLSIGFGQAGAHESAVLTVNASGFEITDSAGNAVTDRYTRTVTDFDSGDYGMIYDSRRNPTSCAYSENLTFRYTGSDGEGDIRISLICYEGDDQTGVSMGLYYTVEDSKIKLTDKRPVDSGDHAALEEIIEEEIIYGDFLVEATVTDSILSPGERWDDKPDINVTLHGKPYSTVMFSAKLRYAGDATMNQMWHPPAGCPFSFDCLTENPVYRWRFRASCVIMVADAEALLKASSPHSTKGMLVAMKQLKMLRPAAPVIPRPLPDGYRFAPFGGTEAEINDWLTICRHGLLPDTPPVGGVYRDWFNTAIRDYPDLDPAEDLFFVVSPDGVRVATSASVRHANGEGYIHMVASLPVCRRKGIGHAMLSHALRALEARGCSHTLLTTDDHRLAAIKTYLDAGFRPVLWHDPESDMRVRWDAVIAELRYEPVPYIKEV